MVLVATQVKRRRGTTAENDAFTGAEGEITVDTEKHELRVHDGVTQGGFVIGAGGSGAGRNIGDVFMTKRTDTALAGAVECDGGTYNTEDYEGDDSIGELLEAGKLDYISLTAYATAISTKGWCDKIGWNGTGTTSFRVPTLTPHIIQTNNIPVVGNGIALGITDGTTNGGLNNSTGTDNSYMFMTQQYGATVGNVASSATHISSTDRKALGVTTDSTKSGIIADTSDTAQLRVMFQLFNGTTDEAVATVGTVVAQVGALNTRTDGMIDYVVEKQDPTAENNYTWYRKYKSGWVEQGGKQTGNVSISLGNAGSLGTITLPVEMKDANYYANAHDTTFCMLGNVSKTNTTAAFQFMPYQTARNLTTVFWEVKGMSAQ